MTGPAAHVTDYAGCIHALRQPDLRQSLYDEAALMMSRVVVNLHGQEHRERRGAEASMFRRDIFLAYERDVLPRTLSETIAPALAEGRADLVDLGYRIMMNLTVDFTGIDRPERSLEETGELLRLLRAFSLAPALGQSVAGDVEDKKAAIRAAMRDFDARFLGSSIARRRGLIAQAESGEIDREALPNDVLTALLLHEDKLRLTQEEWVQEGIFYVLAGAHTTIHSLTHAMHELLTWLDAHPDERWRVEDDPFFVQRCVNESLRLHPSSPVAKRRALGEVRLADGTVLKPGEEVAINLRAANRDPAVFGPDAGRYDPFREVPAGHFRYGLSMGHGVHACLGRQLAIGVDPKPGADPATHQYGVVPLIVAALLRHGVRPDPQQPSHKDETITRITWASYPVVFARVAAPA
jgi:cytochrome P450